MQQTLDPRYLGIKYVVCKLSLLFLRRRVYQIHFSVFTFPYFMYFMYFFNPISLVFISTQYFLCLQSVQSFQAFIIVIFMSLLSVRYRVFFFKCYPSYLTHISIIFHICSHKFPHLQPFFIIPNFP